MTLAVNGLVSSIIQFARSSLVSRLFLLIEPRNSGIAGLTSDPDSSRKLPRGNIRIILGCSLFFEMTVQLPCRSSDAFWAVRDFITSLLFPSERAN